MTEYESPCGTLFLEEKDGALCLCDWKQRQLRTCESDVKPLSPLMTDALRELDEYFRGERREFDIPRAPEGAEFQKKVWSALADIPYGETATYSDIASKTGNPLAVRAVAHAIGANPLSLFLPCHRVIGKNGSLTGYAGGLEAKRYLLNLEGHDY